jgi:2-polyprenyl-3-methyl-5-hydroxy-6-metoxy-1,4-benzoquinol methylase
MSLLLKPKRAIASLGDRYIKRRCQQEFDEQRFQMTNERPIEYGYVFRQLNRLQPKTVLDVGSGTSALPSLLSTCGFVVTATDNVRDYWPRGMLNRHWHTVDDDIRSSKLPGPYDAVICVSTLEHIPDHAKAVSHMLRLTKPGGHLILTAPYNETTYHPNVYKAPEALYGRDLPYPAQSFSRAELQSWLSNGHPATLVHQEYWRCFTGKLWTFGDLLRPPQRANGPEDHHQLTCVTIQRQ